MDIEVSSLGHLIVPDIPDMKIKQLTLWGSQWLGAREASRKAYCLWPKNQGRTTYQDGKCIVSNCSTPAKHSINIPGTSSPPVPAGTQWEG